MLNYALMDNGKIVKEIFIPLMFGIRGTLRHEKRFANIKLYRNGGGRSWVEYACECVLFLCVFVYDGDTAI